MTRGLPHRINFFVAEVYVKLVSKKEMRKIAECEEDEVTPVGLMDMNEGRDTVYVGRWLRTHAKRRETMMHELAHFCLDWRDEGKCAVEGE
jgi:hypothetical protein